MPSIAFITEPNPSRIDAAETAILRELEKQGATTTLLPWDAPASVLKKHDLLVAKTAYNYYRYISEFRDFLERVENTGLTMQNPPETILWNLEKTYLQELESKGFSPAPTMWIPRGKAPNLAKEMRTRGWEKVVLKPTISAGSFNTWVTTPDDVLDIADDFEEALKTQSYMMQRFLPEAISVGEWSLVFINGDISHTILKTPKKGDFRVQKQYGGNYRKLEAPDFVRNIAKKIITSLPTVPLYGRVDGIVSRDQFFLMELELIEPDLYFNICPEALPRFADALLAAA